jgi:hypothetical protein
VIRKWAVLDLDGGFIGPDAGDLPGPGLAHSTARLDGRRTSRGTGSCGDQLGMRERGWLAVRRRAGAE